MNHKDLREKVSTNDPFVQSFLARIPPETAATFTNTQLVELKRVFQARAQRQHYVDIRLSVPLKKRFYLVFLMGRETRHTKRVQESLGKPANQILLRTSILVLITSLLFTLYMVNQIRNNSKLPERTIQKSVQIFNDKD